MLREIVWGLQNGPITKILVLPLTTLFFLKMYFEYNIILRKVNLTYQLPKYLYL